MYDEKDQEAIEQAVYLADVSKNTTADDRAQANDYLDQLNLFQKSEEDGLATTLNNMCDNGHLDLSEDQVNALARKASSHSSATFIVHNPPNAGAQSFFQKAVTQAQHANGAGYSNVSGAHMRKRNQASAARASNTCLTGAASQRASSYGSNLEAAIRQSLQQQQQVQTAGKFSEEETREAVKLSLETAGHFNDASNHSFTAGHFNDASNYSFTAGHFNDASNHSFLSTNSSNSNHKHSQSAPMNGGRYKTPEEEKSTPDYVKSWSERCVNTSFSLDPTSKDFVDVVGVADALTRPYNKTMLRFTEQVEKKHKDGKITSPDGVKHLANVHSTLQK